MCANVSVKEFSDAVVLLEDLQTENEHLVGTSRKVRQSIQPVLSWHLIKLVGSRKQLVESMQLKAWYTEIFDAFSVLKQQYVKLQQERDEVEQQYQHLCDGWRQELEQKQAAFDNARSSILSQRYISFSASCCSSC